jgi:sugar lactone lactonase YvrE
MPSPKTLATLTSTLAAALLHLACTADDGGPPNADGTDTEPAATDTEPAATAMSTGDTDPATTGDVTDASGGSDDTTTAAIDETTAGDDSTGEPAEPEVDVLVELDAEAFELPEGLVIDGDDAVVGFAFTGAIERVALEDGARTPFAATPPPPPNTSFVTGVTLDDAGRLYAAVVSFTAELQAGIYRAPAEGGAAELWASDPGLVFPNGLAWDDTGRLFVSDSTAGISTIDADGLVLPWFQDAQLAGDPTACDQDAAFTVGPNGIAWTPEALWVASSDRGILASVAIGPDGEAGAMELVAGPDCTLGGIDGITLDDDGSVIAAVNRQDRLVRIAADGTVTTLVEGPPLDFPASLQWGGRGEDRALYVTSFALDGFLGGLPASPAIVRVRLPE